MYRNAASCVMIFLIGFLLGILVESKVFGPVRMTSTALASNDSGSTDVSKPIDSNALSKPAPVLAGDMPKFEVDQPIYNFGEAEQGDKLTHTFLLRNVGKSPLTISQVKPACACTVAKLTSATIAPGDSAELQTTLDLRNLSGPQNRAIVVQSNDPKSPNLKLSLVGKSVSHVVREPSILNLGRVLPNAKADGSVEVHTVDNLSFNVTGTHTSGEDIVAKFTAAEPGKKFHVDISFKANEEEGPYRGWVRLLTDNNGPYREIIIPVQAQIGQGGGIFVGDKIDIAGPTVGGDDIDIVRYSGHPVLVVFWASWCGHCQQEVPNLIGLYKKYHRDGLEVVGVSIDRELEKAKAARTKWETPWPDIHFNKNGKAVEINPLVERYQVNGIPAIILVDQHGSVVLTNARGAALDEAIGQLLNSGKVATLTPRK